MPASALAITLAAAVIHATWNALLAGSRDVRAATAIAAVLGAVVFLPVALITWDIGTQAWPYLAGSVAAETASACVPLPAPGGPNSSRSRATALRP